MLVGLGGLAVGALITIGSGAYSQVRADREVRLRIERDDDAYLGFIPISAIAKITNQVDGDPSGILFIELTELDHFSTDGTGFGGRSIFEVTGPDNSRIFDIFNWGNHPVAISAEGFSYQPGKRRRLRDVTIELFDVDDPKRRSLNDFPVELDPGQNLKVGLRIITHAVADVAEYEPLIIINADNTN